MSAAHAIHNSVSNYAGDVSPAQAWQELQNNPLAILIDVRTQPEWVFSGVPSLQSVGKQPLMISWKLYPTMEQNIGFVPAVCRLVAEKDAPIYFLCKTGGRSLDAAIAMTEVGYTQCYNVADGFEGDRDDNGRRGTLSGWKASNLPWEQA